MVRFGRLSGSHEYGGDGCCLSAACHCFAKYQQIRRSGCLNATLCAGASLAIPPSPVSLICFIYFFLQFIFNLEAALS